MNIGHYIYICECADGTWYTGWSTDPEERIRTHNRGRGAKYTRSRLPVRLVYTEGFASKKEAMRREYDIKQMTRKQKEELVEGGRNRMGKIYYLMGKSATGKDHIYERLLSDDRLRQLDLKPLVIYTTRPMRDGEEDGVTYHFTDEAGLRRMEEQGKVIEKRCYETIRGPWYYYTADDGSIDLARHNYLAIGTPAAYKKIRKHFGAGRVQALYVETEDGLRLERALKRERKQEVPQYKEMCRRFLADEKDFAPAKLKSAGIRRIFKNNGTLDECLEEIVDFLLS